MLLTCFKGNFKTIACCCGHDKKNEAYICFDADEITNYLIYLIYCLRKEKVELTLSISSKANNFLNVQNIHELSNMFSIINDYLKKYDKSINYYEYLPDDLKKTLLLYKLLDNNRELFLDNYYNFYGFTLSFGRTYADKLFYEFYGCSNIFNEILKKNVFESLIYNHLLFIQPDVNNFTDVFDNILSESIKVCNYSKKR